MAAPFDIEKRQLLKGASLAVAGGLLIPSAFARIAPGANAIPRRKQDVTPPEDLMREHGVLDRVLLIYEAGLRKFDAREDFDPAVFTSAAQIIRDFIENYHERSEEEAVFPRFKKAGKQVALVDTLLVQHKAGRRVTDIVLQTAPDSRKDGEARGKLVGATKSFIAMYRPHAAREDTELFPLLRQVVSPHEYDAMAEEFEDKEHKLFGADGFEMMVHRVADLEKSIGINDLAKFTPAETCCPSRHCEEPTGPAFGRPDDKLGRHRASRDPASQRRELLTPPPLPPRRRASRRRRIFRARRRHRRPRR